MNSILVSTVSVNGRLYDIYASLEDDQGHVISFTDPFTEAAMHKIDQHVKALFAAHGERAIEEKTIQKITDQGIHLSDNVLVAHSEKAQDIWKRLEKIFIKNVSGEVDKVSFNTPLPLPKMKPTLTPEQKKREQRKLILLAFDYIYTKKHLSKKDKQNFISIAKLSPLFDEDTFNKYVDINQNNYSAAVQQYIEQN